MTETINRYGIYEVDHTKFGGVIYPSDFDTNYTNGNIITRIESDKKFDELCKRNALSKQIYGGKNVKNN